MIQKIRNVLLSLSLLFAMAAPLAIAGSASAITTPTTTNDINNNLCAGSDINISGTSTDCNNTSGADTSISAKIATVINVVSAIVGAIAVIMIIVGGFRYVTSAGNAEGAKAARNTILYAIIGLVIVALAQLIVHFVLNKATS